jgi:hypothetical protein
MRQLPGYFKLITIIVLFAACEDGGTTLNGGESSGQGGSLTRFAISSNYLYVATGNSIGVYNISTNNFQHVRDVSVSFGLETIFANGSYLYLGAQNAMYIYSIANPELPQFVFQYQHIVSCDPVVVQGDRAYVTMKSGTACNLGSNALEIIDISNPNNPVLLVNKPMTSPGGLGIEGNCLFVCEGVHGLRMFNVANPNNIIEMNSITNVNAYDVIVKDGIVTLTGEDGIFQYSFDCLTGNMTLVSTIPVQREEL